MKAVWYERTGPAPEVLTYGEMPTPIAGPGEVRVRLEASGVNPADVGRRGGGYRAMEYPRVIPNSDGAGIIDQVGDGVTRLKAGQRVWLFNGQRNGRAFGTAAEYIALAEHLVTPLPDNLSFAEGATLGIPGMTAWTCLYCDGPIVGQTVLVTGGAGAVGFYAIQFARKGGARVVATVGSAEQERIAREAGAELVVNRREGDVAGAISAAAGGVDRIVEVAFAANLATSLAVLHPSGVIAAYSSDEPEPGLPFWPLVLLGATVRFVLVFAAQQGHAEAIAGISAALSQGWLKSNVGRRLPLECIAEAHELVEAGGGGKVVLEL